MFNKDKNNREGMNDRLTYAFERFLSDVQRIIGSDAIVKMMVQKKFIDKLTYEAIMYSPKLKLEPVENFVEKKCFFQGVELVESGEKDEN